MLEEKYIANFSRKERAAYEESLKVYRDLNNAIETARQEGIAEGLQASIQESRREGKLETAKNLWKMGMATEDIADASGIPVKTPKQLLDQ